MDWFDSLDEMKRPVVEKKEWMDKVDLRLAAADDLDTIASECIEAGIFGLDLEGTGLDTRSFDGASGRRETVDRIVGYCIATGSKKAGTEKGWYIPVRHRDEGAEANVPPRLVAQMINKIQEGGAVAVFHGAKYDQKLLDCEPAGTAGDWDNPDTWEETIILAYLRNTRERRKGLKPLSLQELDREMIELGELFPPEAVKAKKLDFSTLDPTWDPIVWYAAADAVNTLALYEILHPVVVGKDKHGNGQKLIYRIEKSCLRATLWMEDCRIPINRDRLEGLIRLGQDEWWQCITDVYDEASTILGRDVRPSWVNFMAKAGYDPNTLTPNYMETREDALLGSQDGALPSLAKSVPRLDDPRKQETVEFPAVYDVTIPAKVGILLRELGVKGLIATEKSGQVKTSQDVLDRVINDAGDQFPFMAKIKRFREVSKGLGTFLFPIWWDTTPERSPDGCVWANFNGQKVDTGRFSTPTPREKKKEFFHGQVRWGVHMTPATYDTSKPDCVRRTREIVSARPGYILHAIDFAGVELRIVTNLSGEEKWTTEFFRCSNCDHAFERGVRPPPFCPKCGSDKIGDLHSLTALNVFGEGIKADKGIFKQRRQQAKALNFALCYGGGGNAAAGAVGVTKEEGWRIKNKYDKTYTVLQGWWKKQHKKAHDQGYVTTAFGRKYPLPDIRHENGGLRAKAKRNSVNGPVQGCLHPDVRVPTRTGLQTVKDLFEAGVPFEVWTGIQWSEASPLFSGEKLVSETVFSAGGSILTSPEHLFLTWCPQTTVPQGRGDVLEWVRQENLIEGSWVAQNLQPLECPEPTYTWDSDTKGEVQEGHRFHKGFKPHNYKGFSFSGNSENLWEFLGLVYGDGSIHHSRFVLHVGGAESERQAQKYRDRLNAALGLDAYIYCNRRASGRRKSDMWQVKVGNKAFRDFCRVRLGVLDQNTYTKRFPDAVWGESARNRAAFLRGYFSADGHVSKTGDAVSVRSVNIPMLRDTQALLQSIGVRTSCRPKSLRVSVLDRALFRDLIGFTEEYKNQRLASARSNPWVNKTDQAPSGLVRWVGEVVYSSSIYTDLPRPRKSAVLRLKQGSGTRHQCLKYLNRVPKTEIPPDLLELLSYGWQQVTANTSTEERIAMYDVEVHDDFHAFVADGVIVHNTSADIIKLAMAQLYKEFKRRGWIAERRVLMTITIHDELVFEIREEGAGEVVEVIEDIMVNKAVAPLGWFVSLCVDIEFGDDWTVPFNLTQMAWNQGGGAWTERWIKAYPKYYAHYLSCGGKPVGGDAPLPGTVQGHPLKEVDGTDTGIRSPDRINPSPDVPVAPEREGQSYVYRVRNMTAINAERLARIIYRCIGKGMDTVYVRDSQGNDLIGGPIKVAYEEFRVIADYERMR